MDDDFQKLHPKVQAALSGGKSAYKIYDHGNFTPQIRTPLDFASALGYPTPRITKTLFLRSHDGQTHSAAVCSVDQRLDFESTADAIGAKRVKVASLDDLRSLTGYPSGGVSPLGLASGIAVVVDMQLFEYPTVLIGGGTAGIEIELSPAELVRISGATVQSITR